MLKIINRSQIFNNRILLGIIIVGFLLRVIGSNYGYPYIFNIDEPTIVRSTMGLWYSFEIGHFDWPHLTYYLNSIFYFLFIKTRGLLQILQARSILESLFPILWNDPFVFYFITRFLNAVFGTLTIIPVYLLARDMFSKRVGIISAALFALTPYHVYISHVGTPDILLLFFVSWAIYFSYKFSVTQSYKDAVLAGLMYGFASSVKYNAIILSVIVVVFIIHRFKVSNSANIKSLKHIFIKLIVFGIASLVGLLATTPNIITDWDLFWSYEYGKGFLWQLTVNSGPLGLSEYGPALIEQFSKIIVDMGFVIPILFVFGIYKSFTDNVSKEDKGSIIIITGIALGFILFTARYSRATSHYFLPAYSLIVITAAYGLANLKSKIAIYLTLIILGVLSIYRTMLFVRDDTRNIAFKYYEESHELDGDVYFDGNDLSEADMINNMGMKRAKNGYELDENDLVLSQTEIKNNDKIVLIETIGNFFRKGPTIYVYKKAN